VAMAFKLKALIALGPIACFGLVLSGCGSSSSSSNSALPSAAATGTTTTPNQTSTATTVPPASPTTTATPPATSTPNPAVSPPAKASTPPAAASSSLVSNTNGGDACLPIAMPTADAVFKSAKKVFAHYFYPFPISVDNRMPVADYYNTQYLNKNGESNKWLPEGGYLRQRPLGVNTIADAHWRQLNMQHEVTAAIARGITGFTFNVMSVDQATTPTSQLHTMLSAAAAVDSRFKIIVMPDLTALGTNADAVVEIIASVAKSPAAYKLADGRLVVSAFDANIGSPAWWASVLSRLKTKGINVAFVPTFLGWTLFADLYSAVSYGLADWGTATANASDLFANDSAIAHDNNKIFMMPVDGQQYRPKNFEFWEAGNSASFRSGWMGSIEGDADWVQLVTWNDLSESSQIAPYTDTSLKRTIGTGFYDLSGYYAAWYLTGHQPTITHDVLYYFYRREPSTAKAPAQSQSDHVVGDAAENNIELLAFLTAPGELKITVGGKTFTKSAPAGMMSFKVPTQPGIPLFTLSRNGAVVFSFEGGVQIYGTGGIPSGVADMTYWSGSAAKSGICSL
jgi:hypothetical protein